MFMSKFHNQRTAVVARMSSRRQRRNKSLLFFALASSAAWLFLTNSFPEEEDVHLQPRHLEADNTLNSHMSTVDDQDGAAHHNALLLGRGGGSNAASSSSSAGGVAGSSAEDTTTSSYAPVRAKTGALRLGSGGRGGSSSFSVAPGSRSNSRSGGADDATALSAGAGSKDGGEGPGGGGAAGLLAAVASTGSNRVGDRIGQAPGAGDGSASSGGGALQHRAALSHPPAVSSLPSSCWKKPQLRHGDGDQIVHILNGPRVGKDVTAVPCPNEEDVVRVYGPNDVPDVLSKDARDQGQSQGSSSLVPLLIRHHLTSVPDGSFVVYHGAQGAATERADITRVLQVMDDRGSDLALIEHPKSSDAPSTTTAAAAAAAAVQMKDIYAHFNIDVVDATKSQMTTKGYAPEYVIVRKNPTTQKFISDWVDAAAAVAPPQKNPQEVQHFHSVMLTVLIKDVYGEPDKKECINNDLPLVDDGLVIQTFALHTLQIPPSELLLPLRSSSNQADQGGGGAGDESVTYGHGSVALHPPSEQQTVRTSTSSNHNKQAIMEAGIGTYGHRGAADHEGMVNLALHKPVYASTSCYDTSPVQLTDGNTTTVHKFCHKGGGTKNWIIMDLQRTTKVHHVVVHAHYDPCCPGRLVNYVVEVLDETADDVVATRSYSGRASDGDRGGVTIDFNDYSSRWGRYVRLRLFSSEQDWFQFSQVEVHVKASLLPYQFKESAVPVSRAMGRRRWWSPVD